MEVSRREFIDLSTRAAGGLAGLLAGGSALSAFSPLEQEVLPGRKVIGTFNDGSFDLGVVEMYSNGMFLTQNVRITDDYSAEVLYFIRDGKTKESEWSVRCDLYKKGTPAAVKSIMVEGAVEGSVESGKLIVLNMPKLDPKNLEDIYIGGAYAQSGMQSLEKSNPAKSYLDYFRYQLGNLINDKLKMADKLKPMPQGYNPLAK